MSNEELFDFIRKNPVSCGCGLVSLILAVGLYFRWDHIPAAEAELAQKTAESERLGQNLKNSTHLKEQLDAITAAAKVVDSRIIRAGQVGNNTQYFYRLESDTGVKMVDFRPQPIAPPAKGAKTTYTPVPFNVTVQGTLPQVLDFARALEGGARYARILSASLSGAPANRKGPLTLTLAVELLGLP